MIFWHRAQAICWLWMTRNTSPTGSRTGCSACTTQHAGAHGVIGWTQAQRLAHDRGYALSPELLHYMQTHLSRDLSRLSILMAAFDRYALATQRTATVPLLKSLLADQPQLLRTTPHGTSGS